MARHRQDDQGGLPRGGVPRLGDHLHRDRARGQAQVMMIDIDDDIVVMMMMMLQTEVHGAPHHTRHLLQVPAARAAGAEGLLRGREGDRGNSSVIRILLYPFATSSGLGYPQ